MSPDQTEMGPAQRMRRAMVQRLDFILIVLTLILAALLLLLGASMQ